MALTPEEKVMSGNLIATLRDWIVGKVNACKPTALSCTLPTTGWSDNTITVTCTGVTATDNLIVTAAPASYTEYCDCGIYCSGQSANSLTFTRSKANTNTITANVLRFA